MANEYRFLLTSQDGIVLETENTYVDRNIVVEPNLDEITVSSSNETQIIAPKDKYIGFSQITVNPIKKYDGTVKISSLSSIIGVSGLTSPTGTLILTDGAADVGTYTTSTSGNYVSVSNPLSDFFPYNQLREVEDEYGNQFIEFPKFWMCWSGYDAKGHPLGYKIAASQIDENWFVPDAFLDPRDKTGNTYVDSCWIAKYQGCATTINETTNVIGSKTGQEVAGRITRSVAREACRAYGNASNYYNGYHQWDFATWTMYNLLCMLFYRTTNIQSVWGGRTGAVHQWEDYAPTGTTDGVNGLDGWNIETDCTKMLGIESPYENKFIWLDGFNTLYGDGVGTIHVQRFVDQHSDLIENDVELGFIPSYVNGTGVITALRHGTSSKTQSYMFVSDGIRWNTSDSNTFIGDAYYYWVAEDSSPVVLFPYVGGGYWNDATNAPYCGLWCAGVECGASDSYPFIGARAVRKILK